MAEYCWLSRCKGSAMRVLAGVLGTGGVLGWGTEGLGLPCVCCLTTVGREKVCMPWGPKALEGAGSSLFHC